MMEIVVIDEEEEDQQLFSDTQQIILQATSIITGTLSMIGSSIIIYKILFSLDSHQSAGGGRIRNSSSSGRTRRSTRVSTSTSGGTTPCCGALRLQIPSSVYHRLMLGLSCLDVLFSFGNAGFSFWSIPQEVSTYVYGASGSWTSCEVGGFFMNFMLGTTMYSAFLAMYFVLLVKFEIKEEYMSKKLEPFWHCLAIGFPLVTAPIAIAKDYFNPLRTVPGTCWFDDYPPTCSQDPNTECIRGDGYKLLALICGAVSIFFSLICVTTCMVLLVLKVRQTELQMKQYAGSTSSQNAELQLTKQTGKQALLYISAYFTTFFALVTLQFLEAEETRKNRTLYFAVGFLAKLLTPLQGVFNCLIFIYRSSSSGNNSRRNNNNGKRRGSSRKEGSWSTSSSRHHRSQKRTVATASTTATSSTNSRHYLFSSVVSNMKNNNWKNWSTMLLWSSSTSATTTTNPIVTTTYYNNNNGVTPPTDFDLAEKQQQKQEEEEEEEGRAAAVPMPPEESHSFFEEGSDDAASDDQPPPTPGVHPRHQIDLDDDDDGDDEDEDLPPDHPHHYDCEDVVVVVCQPEDDCPEND